MENSTSLNFYSTVSLNTTIDVTKLNLNFTFNQLYLNASALPAFNTTARITLNVSGSGFLNPRPTFEVDDHGTFA